MWPRARSVSSSIVVAVLVLSACAPSPASLDGWEGGGVEAIEGYWTTGELGCSDGCPVELADARQILNDQGRGSRVTGVTVASLPWMRTDGHGTVVSARAGLGQPVLVVAHLDDGDRLPIGMYCEGPSYFAATGEVAQARRCQPMDIETYRVGAGIPTS